MFPSKTASSLRQRFGGLALAGLCLFALSTTAGCGSRGSASSPDGGNKEPAAVAQAKVARVVMRRMRDTVELLGVTEPEPNAASIVSAQISARILQLPLREGDPVRAGQTVAVLDPGETPAQLTQAKAQLEAAVTDTRQAGTAVEQEKTRVQSDRRQAEAALAAARAQVSRVQSELKALRAGNKADVAKAQAALDTARQDLARVKAGSRPQEIAAARAAVMEADALRQNAVAQAKRAIRLAAQEVLSQKQLEDAQAQARVTEAQYQAALQRQRLAEEGSRKEDIAVSEARVREAEAGVQAVQTAQLNQASKLQELAATQAQVDQAQAALDRAKAAGRDITFKLQQRERTVAQLRQARGALQQVQARGRYLTVTAPVSGVISRRAANQGDTTQPGTVLVEIAEPGRVRFRAAAPTTRLAGLRAGQPAEIRFDTITAAPLPARVSIVGSAADAGGNGTVWLTVTRAGLRPGLSGKARVTLRQETAPAVPVGALIQEESGDAVVVVGGDNVAHRRQVKLGLREGGWVQVREGVRSGERVATVGAFEIADGMTVSPTSDAQKKP